MALASAYNASVRIGDSFITSCKWTARSFNTKNDVTTFEDEGFSRVVKSIHDATFTVEGFYDLADGITLANFLYSGADMAQQLKLYLAFEESDAFWHFPKWYCEEFEQDVEVRGPIPFKFSGVNQGRFYLPDSPAA